MQRTFELPLYLPQAIYGREFTPDLIIESSNISANMVIGVRVAELSKEQRALRDVLIDARVKANLTQRELARRIKRGQSIIGMIELGKRQVTVLELIQIAHALNVDPVKLFGKVVRESNP